MRAALVAALWGSTALLGPASLAVPARAQGQPQVTPNVVPAGEAQARAAIASCDRLITVIQDTRPANTVTADQARTWLQASDAGSCQRELDRIAEGARTGSTPANQAAATPPAPVPPSDAATASAPPASPPASAAAPQPAPVATAGQPAPAAGAAPQVVVQQAQPNVTVRQAQPEIIVRMPPPVITVQQAQPEIIVRMPEPDVNVAVAQPQVQVTIPQPQVQVQPPAPQSQANVQVERQQPNVRLERTGEPQIIYRPAEGQPQIRFEPVGPAGGMAAANPPAAGQPAGAVTPQAAQAQLNPQGGYGTSPSTETQASAGAAPQTTGALPAATTAATPVSRLKDMTLYNAREEKLGEVDAVAAAPGGRTFVLVSYGGFLGLGERRVAIPIESLAVRADRLVADTLTDEQLKALPDIYRNAGYREMEGNQIALLRVLR